ncbi:MAG: DUF3841 domain-containing protein [Tissierellaceae bacterium]|nr:DUF3841 domain-containing protein [Tissierellaceae bacterium]
MGKVTLWTRQDIRSLKDLEEKGVHRIQKWYIEEQFEDISDHYIPLYRWFVNKANEKVPKPEGVEFPIWCSISEKSMLRPIVDSVVYVVDIDESEVIYFDGRKWDYVLNHLYLPKDEEDMENYKKEIERKGLKDSFSFIDGKYASFYPLEKKKVMDSWTRVFEIEDWNIFGVQANIWEIRKDMVKDIIHYKG